MHVALNGTANTRIPQVTRLSFSLYELLLKDITLTTIVIGSFFFGALVGLYKSHLNLDIQGKDEEEKEDAVAGIFKKLIISNFLITVILVLYIGSFVYAFS